MIYKTYRQVFVSKLSLRSSTQLEEINFMLTVENEETHHSESQHLIESQFIILSNYKEKDNILLR